MKWLVTTLIVILILGPLRRWFFWSWRFNVPALLTGFATLVLMSHLLGEREPKWFPVAGAAFVALGAGAAVKRWLDEVFGKEK